MNSVYLSEVTPEEIINEILQSLRNGAAGYDGLSSSIVVENGGFPFCQPTGIYM